MNLITNNINFKGSLTVTAATPRSDKNEYGVNTKEFTVDTENIKAIRRISNGTILDLYKADNDTNLKELRVFHGVRAGSFDPTRHDSIINAYNAHSRKGEKHENSIIMQPKRRRGKNSHS